MNYKIIGADSRSGSLLIKFYNDGYPNGLVYNVDIPIENGQFVSGEALEAHIMSFAPYGQLERMAFLSANETPFPNIAVEPELHDPILDAPLEESITFALNQIDGTASETRKKFVSTGAGQDAVYVAKATQAAEFRDRGFSDPVPPYIAAEANAFGRSPQAVAETILTVNTRWNDVIGPAIEAARLLGKAKVRACATVQEVDTELRAANLAIQAVSA